MLFEMGVDGSYGSYLGGGLSWTAMVLVQHPTPDASLGEADIRDGNGAMGNGAKR